MNLESQKGKSFFGVAMALILSGAVIFAIGVVAWIANCYLKTTVISIPSVKIIGGLVIMGLGYILLVLEAIRNK